MFSIKFDTTAIRASLEKLGVDILYAADAAMRETVQEAHTHAKATTLFNDSKPVSGDKSGHRPGTLRASIRGSANGLTGTLVAGGKSANYASFVESGTRAHEIRPKDRRGKRGMLRFVVNGQIVFARSVRHPGTSPRPFMAEAASFGQQALEQHLSERIDAAIDAHNAR